MASITYDGRSFMLDGRRIWVVSGAVHHARIPEAEWADRLHAARLAGLNTIETTVFWSQVEPRPGHFDFTGQADVRRFIRMVGQAGMHCILRPGPFVGSGWDLGGLPAWLVRNPAVTPRSGNQPFLEACSRYITALAEQVRDLQVTAQGGGGPIILVEQERAWTCGDDDLAHAYLGELARYFREAGFNVPAFNSNNLWQGLEGQIDAWRGESGLYAIVRQLAGVRPDQPRLVVDFPVARPPRFGVAAEAEVAGPSMLRRAAEATAAGAQMNFSTFAACAGRGSWPGRSATSSDELGQLSAAPDPRAAIDASGAPTGHYGPIRRLATFASGFARVLAAASEDTASVVIDPDGHGADPSTSVLRSVGPQGSVAWVFATPGRGEGRRAKAGPTNVPLILSDGAVLTVPVGGDGVAWCLMNVNLTNRAQLDHASLSVMAFGGDMLVCFGPAGSEGEVSINGTAVRVSVPKDGAAVVEKVEGVTLVVVCESTADTTFLTAAGVYVGAHSVTPEGEPVPAPGPGRKLVLITADGEARAVTPKRARGGAAAKAGLGVWTHAPAAEHAAGESPRFATIDGPQDLSALGVPHGYGWYRATVKAAAAKRVRVAAPGCRDRLAVFVDGQPAGVLGYGPGTKPDLGVSLKKGDRVITVLAENAGQPFDGSTLVEPKGLTRHLCEVAPVKLAKPEIAEGEPVEPLTLRLPLIDVRRGDATNPFRIRWTVAHRRKTPLAIDLGPVPVAGLVMLGGVAHRFMDAGSSMSMWLDGEELHRGNNIIEFAAMGDPAIADPMVAAEKFAADLAQACRVMEVVGEVTAKSAWAFAKWEPPAESAFEPVGKAAVELPCWWRSGFEADPTDDHPLALDLTGMTKGVVYLNGARLLRYFVALADGTPVPGAGPIDLPASLLKAGANDVMLFDEHGGHPAKVKLVRDTERRRITAARRV